MTSNDYVLNRSKWLRKLNHFCLFWMLFTFSCTASCCTLTFGSSRHCKSWQSIGKFNHVRSWRHNILSTVNTIQLAAQLDNMIWFAFNTTITLHYCFSKTNKWGISFGRVGNQSPSPCTNLCTPCVIIIPELQHRNGMCSKCSLKCWNMFTFSGMFKWFMLHFLSLSYFYFYFPDKSLLFSTSMSL